MTGISTWHARRIRQGINIARQHWRDRSRWELGYSPFGGTITENPLTVKAYERTADRFLPERIAARKLPLIPPNPSILKDTP